MGTLKLHVFYTLAGTLCILLGLPVQSGRAAAFVVELQIHDNNSVSGNAEYANTRSQQVSPVVINAIEDIDHKIPMFWPALTASRISKDCYDFLNSDNTGMTWHNADIGLNTSHMHQASILSSPVFFLSESISNNGSPSAAGKLLINTRKKKFHHLIEIASQKRPDVNVKNNSDLVKDGKIDIDLILIISAGVSGLLLILIPERKRKRDLIRETNLALLRRPRQ